MRPETERNNKTLFLSHQDRLHGNAKISSDVAALVYNGDFVHQRNGVQQIAEVNESTSHHSEPGESVVERISTRQTLHIVVGRGGAQLCFIVVHFAHQLQAVSVGDE